MISVSAFWKAVQSESLNYLYDFYPENIFISNLHEAILSYREKSEIEDEKPSLNIAGQILHQWFAPMQESEVTIAIDELVNAMLNDDADNSLTLTEALTRLQNIRQSIFNTKSRVIRLAYLDIQDYQDSDDFKKSETIKLVSQCDKIWLVGEVNNNDIAELAQDLSLNDKLPIQNTMILCNIAMLIKHCWRIDRIWKIVMKIFISSIHVSSYTVIKK